MDEVAIAGPSRHKRNEPHLADRIVALQRKNAASPSSSRTASRRQAEADEFNRGIESRSSNRTLFDPSRPVVAQPVRDPGSEDKGKRRGPSTVPPPPGRSEPTVKKLFNPDIHDPHQFQRKHQPLPPTSESSSNQSRSLLRRLPNGSNGRMELTPEEEADKERERRKRREGSERGSAARKKEHDTRSKGSRSSEGSESLKDRERGKGKADSGVKAILKDIHNKIRTLEAELTEMHRKMAAEPEAGISVLMDRSERGKRISSEDDAKAWFDLIGKHKDLADLHHLFLVRVFDPLVPSTFQQLAVKYSIPSRLWQVSFHLILERLRYAWMTSHPTALDLLTDLVYDAYKFYTDLLEDQALNNFRTAWIEALGDLARYRMAIASHVGESSRSAAQRDSNSYLDNLDEKPANDGASIGAEVAQHWDVEDKETWRTTARDWYNMGITEKPGEGRLHHHLALLSRDIRGQEGRSLHHFAKSLVVTHQYSTSRESLLPLFDSALQSQRSLPEATAMDLFVRLHGMLFTKIDLDNFTPVMSRFMERLEEDARLDGVSRKATITQVDWIIIAAVNIASMLQYGSSSGILRKAMSAEGQERRRALAVAGDDGELGDGDGGENGDHPPIEDGPAPSNDDASELPLVLLHALHLSFSVLRFTLAHPTRQQGLHAVLNPYITLLLTFVSTLSRQSRVASILADHVPWAELVSFLNQAGLDIKEETRLASGPPLPEDWAVRGMEWVGRRVYERGFWKAKSSGRGSGAMAQPQPRSGERFQSEMDVLLANFDSTMDISEGVIDEAEGTDLTDGPVAVNQRRWKRVAWAAGVILKHVDGFEMVDIGLVITGSLKERLDEIERVKRVEEEQQRLREKARRERERVDEEEVLLEVMAESGDENDPEIRALRERRQHLRSMVAPSQRKKAVKKALNAVPGYTMLVFDTNVFLSSLDVFKSVVEGGQWSVIVPLPVVTELDGLSKNSSPLGQTASQAIAYLESRIRTHSLCLKIQTSRGNYLSDLLIRTEHVDFSDPQLASRNMDDLILNVAAFQSDHFTDRSAVLGQLPPEGPATKVVLVTFDRNLRLRARARGIDAADEKELKGVLSGG